MRRVYGLLALGFVIFCGVVIYGCVVREATSQTPNPGFHHGFLRVTELVMAPDPVREGQRFKLSMVMVNDSSHSRRVSIAIRDENELVCEASDIAIRPGANRISFPRTGYRFTRREPCLTVLVDIEGTSRPVDLARRFCVQPLRGGWSLAGY
jgi:hypothetical protein